MSTSMSLSSFNQRSWAAGVNSKRAIQINDVKNELTIKYCSLFWSNSTAVDLNINAPAADPDVPLGSETSTGRNSRPFKLGGIKPTQNGTGEWTQGYAEVYTPSGETPFFDLVNDTTNTANADLTVGNEVIRYINDIPQLVEIEAAISVTCGATVNAHTVFVSVFVNGTETNTLAGDVLPSAFARSIVIVDNVASDDLSISNVFKHKMILNKNDKVKLVVWKSDSNNGSPVLLNAARLSVRTLP